MLNIFVTSTLAHFDEIYPSSLCLRHFKTIFFTFTSKVHTILAFPCSDSFEETICCALVVDKDENAVNGEIKVKKMFLEWRRQRGFKFFKMVHPIFGQFSPSYVVNLCLVRSSMDT